MDRVNTNPRVVAILGIATLVAYHLFSTQQKEPTEEQLEGQRKDGLPAKTGKTFRVRGVPVDWDIDQLQTFLAAHDKSCGPDVRSLARELDDRSLTATVTFQSVPDSLRSCKPWELPLPPSSDQLLPRSLPLVLDADFLGMTTLFAPVREDHKVDVIAVPGLGGHAFGSFKQRGGEHMWLRDSLPHDLTSENTERPMARVITYGYASGLVDSPSMQNIEDLGTAFRASLLQLANSRSPRPIVFVAHSLGGLVIKQTVITLSKSKSEEDKSILQAVYGITFYGVPHDGMDIKSLVAMVGDGPNRYLVESISRTSSQVLSDQRQAFTSALGNEGETEVNEHGAWEMTGPLEVLVTKSSATICRPWEDGPEHICAIARSHSHIVKFGPQDEDYCNSRERLRRLARRALTVRHRIQSSGTRFIVPYIMNPDFVERPHIMNALKTQLGYDQSPESARPRSRVSLHGLGGAGKTQVALAYVYWLQEAVPDVSILWIHASSAARFRQSFLSIAQECQVPGHDDPKADVLSLMMSWLSKKQHGRWLMVIDNADDKELFFGRGGLVVAPSTTTVDDNLARYIPECAHGRILITTRNSQVGLGLTKGQCPIRVNSMDQDESLCLLTTILGSITDTTNELSALATRLEGLPLALIQAAAFIHENHLTIDRYLQLLSQNNQSKIDLLGEKFETVGQDSEAPRTVAQTWMLSFRQISQQNELAGQLLSVMSLFDRQGIPISFLSHFSNQERNGGPTSELKLEKSLGILKSYSLISEEKDHRFNMHRLVHLLTRNWLLTTDMISRFKGEALLTVSDMYPNGKFETRTVCAEYLPHAMAVLETDVAASDNDAVERAYFLGRIASYMIFEGRWKDAEIHLVKAIRKWGETSGDEDPLALNHANDLAIENSSPKQYAKTEHLELSVQEASKRILGDGNADWLSILNNLALVYLNQSRWAEAEQLLVRIVETTAKTLGDEHPQTIISMNNTASTYLEQGRGAEAEQLFTRVLEAEKRIFGDEHPRTIVSLNNLASTYLEQGRSIEAEQLHARALEISKRVFGDEHPTTLTIMANLGQTWYRLGRWGDALTLLEDCARLQEKVLGENHPDTQRNRSTLGCWQVKVSRIAE